MPDLVDIRNYPNSTLYITLVDFQSTSHLFALAAIVVSAGCTRPFSLFLDFCIFKPCHFLVFRVFVWRFGKQEKVSGHFVSKSVRPGISRHHSTFKVSSILFILDTIFTTSGGQKFKIEMMVP